MVLRPDRRWSATRIGGRRIVDLLILIAFGSVVWLSFGQRTSPAAGVAPVEPPPNQGEFRVAFFADTGYATLSASDLRDLNAYTDSSLPLPARVMKLVRAEGADLALHGGDIGYDEAGSAVPEKWDRMVTQILGADFPLFASGGNHDQRHWYQAPAAGSYSGLGYRDVLRRRYEAVERSSFGADLRCSFPTGASDIGQRASCSYRDALTFITVGLGAGNGIPPTEIGRQDNAYESYLKSALAASTTPWTVCNWHFNQTLFQTGFKTNEAGWKPYQYCLDAGALIATGHEHAYSRTHLMSRMSAASGLADIVSRSPDMTIDERQTIAWVSGLGGKGIRTTSFQEMNPWWAAKVNLTNHSATDGGGVLFCDFSTSDNAHAECFYKTVDGVVRDRFRLVSNANGASGTFDGFVPETTQPKPPVVTTNPPISTSTPTDSTVDPPTTATPSTAPPSTAPPSTAATASTAPPSTAASTAPPDVRPPTSTPAFQGPVATIDGDGHATRSAPQPVVEAP